jgi:High potential iron-sulfur protein
VHKNARSETSEISEESHVKKIPRRTFIQLSAAAATGCLMQAGRPAMAQDLPHLTEDDPMAQAMKYTHDASTVDASAKPNPAENQHCATCALVQGEDGAEWRPCQIFPGKLVNANGWCSVWAPKA